MKIFNVLFLGTILIWFSNSAYASADGYEKIPYTPISNNPGQLEEKRAALDKFREQVKDNVWNWDQLGYTQDVILKELEQSDNAITDPSIITNNFNLANGEWHKRGQLKTQDGGYPFTDEDYALNNEYVIDVLALAYTTKHIAGEDHKSLVFKSLGDYFKDGYAPPHEYNRTFTYGSGPGRPNLCKLFLMIGHTLYDEIHTERETNEDVSQLFNSMRSYCSAFINAGPQFTGANWGLRMDHCLNYVLFTNEIADMDQYAYHWKNSLKFIKNTEYGQGEGIYPDWSMKHHSVQNYWGKYGEILIYRPIVFGEIFKDTPWAYNKKNLNFIAKSMMEGMRWSFYRGTEDSSVAGDQALIKMGHMDSDEAFLSEHFERLIAVGKGDFGSAVEKQLVEANDNYSGPFWSKTDIFSPLVSTGRLSNLSGHRYFWETDYQAHRRPNYAIYTKRLSKRTQPVESRTDAQTTLHFSSGYTPIYVDGDETFVSRLAWDFDRMPGVTVETKLDKIGGGAATTKRSKHLFSAGVTDKTYGFGGFDMELVEFERAIPGQYVFPGYVHINGARALKSTFFFDEGMVALGQKIQRVATVDVSGEQHDIITTINNTRRVADVVYSINGSNEVTISVDSAIPVGTVQPIATDSLEGEKYNINSVSWIHHNNVGYVIWPSKSSTTTQLVLSAGKVQLNDHGKLKSEYYGLVDRVLGRTARDEIYNSDSMNMFRAWIDHGTNPDKATYEYAVLPDISVAELKAFVANPSIKIAENSKGVQAVFNPEAGLYYALFRNKSGGVAKFNKRKSFETFRPLMVMGRKHGNDFKFHAVNPIHRAFRINIAGDSSFVGALIKDPVQVSLTGFDNINTNYFKFPTGRGKEGASVQGTVNQ